MNKPNNYNDGKDIMPKDIYYEKIENKYGKSEWRAVLGFRGYLTKSVLLRNIAVHMVKQRKKHALI